MKVNEPVEQLPVEIGGAVFPCAPAPPEPVTVHLMVWPPQDGDMGVLELFEEDGNRIHLGAPMLMEFGARREHIPELLIRELTLDARQFFRIAARQRAERDGFCHDFP